MGDITSCQFQAFDQQENSNAVGDHRKRPPLRRTLPIMQKTGSPITVPQEYQRTVKIKVKKQNELWTAINVEPPTEFRFYYFHLTGFLHLPVEITNLPWMS